MILTPTAIADLRRLPEPEVPCRNPGCPNVVRYRRSGGGRQQIFCSGACRAAFSRRRDALLVRLERIKETLNARWTSTATAVDLDALKSECLWEMDRLGIEPPPEQVAPTPQSRDALLAMSRAMLDYLKVLGLWDLLIPLPHHEDCEKCRLEYDAWREPFSPRYRVAHRTASRRSARHVRELGI